MKFKLTILFVALISITQLLSSCSSKENELNSSEEASVASENEAETSARDYYKKEDFQSITLGESTYQDVHKIAPIESMQITSYGGFCQYPMQNGGYVRIKFYGKHLIVGAVEELSGEVDLH